MTLPETAITVVSRSDGSGTTFVFTTHLSAISPDWKSGPGARQGGELPGRRGGKGKPGVTALIKQTPGAIGYVEYGYAKQTGMPMASLENKSGKFIKPDLASGQKALASVELPANLRAWIPDPPKRTRTRSSPTPGCFATRSTRSENGRDTQDGRKYGLNQGQKFSADLGYVPLPRRRSIRSPRRSIRFHDRAECIREISRPPDWNWRSSVIGFSASFRCGRGVHVVLVSRSSSVLRGWRRPAVHTYGFSPLVGTTWDAIARSSVSCRRLGHAL